MLARFLYSRKKDTLKSTYYTRTPIIFYVKLLEQDSYTLKYETNTQLSQYSYPGADKKKDFKDEHQCPNFTVWKTRKNRYLVSAGS